MQKNQCLILSKLISSLETRYKLKKCLLIAYYFPPREGIGSQRPSKLAKYFPEFGWEPIVLTAQLPGKPQNGLRIIETDYKDVLASAKSLFGFDRNRSLQEQINIHVSKNYTHDTLRSKIIKFAKEIIAYPDYQRGWYKYAIQSAHEFLEKEKVDILLSTSSPVISHVIARELKKMYRIPWVADLRDLWTQNHFYGKYRLIRYFEKRLELKTLALSDAIVTVTPGFEDKLKILHEDKSTHCLTNGFDGEDFKGSRKLKGKFAITHTGMLYAGRRDPSLLFEALSMLIDENKIDRKLLELRFYGPQEDWLFDEVKKYRLDGNVVYGNVSREQALEKQRESQILLLLLDKNNNEEDVYPAKLFEYFGARRPIIAFGGSGGAVKDLLEKTKAGEFAMNKEGLKSILYKCYQQFVAAGEVGCSSNDHFKKFMYENITKRYAEILNGIVMK